MSTSFGEAMVQASKCGGTLMMYTAPSKTTQTNMQTKASKDNKKQFWRHGKNKKSNNQNANKQHHGSSSERRQPPMRERLDFASRDRNQDKRTFNTKNTQEPRNNTNWRRYAHSDKRSEYRVESTSWKKSRGQSHNVAPTLDSNRKPYSANRRYL